MRSLVKSSWTNVEQNSIFGRTQLTDSQKRDLQLRKLREKQSRQYAKLLSDALKNGDAVSMGTQTIIVRRAA